MKILYGVQGTGNGHISRARALATAFKNYPDIEVTWLFTGRDKKDFFDMDIFGDYLWFKGLTFVTRNGQIQNIETLLNTAPMTFIQDIKTLASRLSQYDIIASDYEPVTAWAARRAKRDVIGIGHQYAFNYDIPISGENLITKNLMKYFAPASLSLGLHWHNFGKPILPPIAEVHDNDGVVIDNKVLVYLPFEDNDTVIALLKPINNYEFFVYSPGLNDKTLGHIHTRKPSREGFQYDLSNAHSVISNCGFELISEALMLGKRILTKPVKGQMEQQSNAEALKQLNLASIIHQLDTQTITSWLQKNQNIAKVIYPNVAAAICEWLINIDRPSPQTLADSLWEETQW